MLFIATGPEEEPIYWMVRHYYDRAGEPREWWVVPEAAHGHVPAVRPAEYEEKIVAFFDSALLH